MIKGTKHPGYQRSDMCRKELHAMVPANVYEYRDKRGYIARICRACKNRRSADERAATRELLRSLEGR